MLRLVFLLFLTAGCYCFGYAQSDFKSSGRCIEFDGVDDYIDLGNILDNLALPLTVEAWVYVDGTPAYVLPVFSSQDNLPLYNGVDFGVTATRITGGYGDGRGENSGQYRRAKSQTIASIADKWTHVAIVVNGPLDMQLFVNGVDVGGHYDGSTNLPMSSNSPGDVAKVGQWTPNGNAYFFKGKMDEVRVWNRGRTADEIRTTMCQKLKGNEPGLVGNWSFNETSGTAIHDQSPVKHAAGIMHGSTRSYSGAPIGDISTYQYAGTWSGSSLQLIQGDDALKTSNLEGNPQGVHIYYVNEHPSRSNGLDLTAAARGYFGVFVAADAGYRYTATYSYEGAAPCALSRRPDNSVGNWTSLASGGPLTATARLELIRTGVSGSDPSLGPDQFTCSGAAITLRPTAPDPAATFRWSTGQTSPSIVVSTAGKYWVAVTDACGTSRDTIQVSVASKPQASLGPDRTSCDESVLLRPMADATGVNFLWRNGSTSPQLEARVTGSYWVAVSNACGADRDTVDLVFPPAPEADLGVDRTLCDVSTLLTPLANPIDFTFLWQDGSMAPSFVATTSGTYWVRVSSVCRSVTDTVRLSLVNAAPVVSLGEDQIACKVAAMLTPVADPTGLTFEWQDGSTTPQLEAKVYGTYWVQVSNACGSTRDSVTITQKIYPILSPPNVITPNGDEKNETFNLPVDPHAGAVSLAIFNRWGQRVYVTDDYKNTWTGSGLSEGVYFYRATGECVPETKGAIHILR
ncbi:LamG-like jellyroll fold domain-containing protein [Dawidia soli]|uniref:Gliding motility-associated C-terminal domain-containing protein n=1 Tax=Dawidia soli TaxID=2782352 RepID=A0AAP2GJ31_9BACT|nr:LamG-like jellyroll fold domain-containing protein [Dawidia soli]MBT1688971.1 gliding motility-associated C-terminal domain-containing protein [Dawidia soli]